MSDAAFRYTGIHTIPRFVVNLPLALIIGFLAFGESFRTEPLWPLWSQRTYQLGLALWALAHLTFSLSSAAAVVGREAHAARALRIEAMGWRGPVAGLALTLVGLVGQFPTQAHTALAEAQAEAALIDAWKATRALEPGEVITEGDVERVPHLGRYLPEDLMDGPSVVGRVVVAPVLSGELVRPGRLADTSPYPPVATGHRLIVAPVRGDAPLDHPQVDVIWTRSSPCVLVKGARVQWGKERAQIEVPVARAAAVQVAAETGWFRIEAARGRPSCSW